MTVPDYWTKASLHQTSGLSKSKIILLAGLEHIRKRPKSVFGLSWKKFVVNNSTFKKELDLVHLNGFHRVLRPFNDSWSSLVSSAVSWSHQSWSCILLYLLKLLQQLHSVLVSVWCGFSLVTSSHMTLRTSCTLCAQKLFLSYMFLSFLSLLF